MSPVSIPYSPGYSDAVQAWATYLWKRHRRAVGWFLVSLSVDLLVIAAGFWNWRLWLTSSALVLTAAVGLVPLAFRLLWAYKIRQLGIHELEVSDGGIRLHGTGLQVQSPLETYDGILETTRYFILTRPNGLFSFIPKRHVSTDAIDRVRGILHAGISGRRPRVPGGNEMAP